MWNAFLGAKQYPISNGQRRWPLLRSYLLTWCLTKLPSLQIMQTGVQLQLEVKLEVDQQVPKHFSMSRFFNFDMIPEI